MAEAPRMTPTAVKFFAKFTRFEFAMKNIPEFRIVDQNNGGVTPGWDSLANFLIAKQSSQAFFANLAANSKTKYLIESPPRKRIVNAHGDLDWTAQPNRLVDIRETCLMLRRVRNNLAHGDKFYSGSERNRKLLSAANNILDEILNQNPDLYNYYVF